MEKITELRDVSGSIVTGHAAVSSQASVTVFSSFLFKSDAGRGRHKKERNLALGTLAKRRPLKL